MYKIHI